MKPDWKKKRTCSTCRHLDTWTENQSPLGSGMNWPMRMAECAAEAVEDFGEEDVKDCPSWKPIMFKRCDECGTEFEGEGRPISEMFEVAGIWDVEWTCSETCRGRLVAKVDEAIRQMEEDLKRV